MNTLIIIKITLGKFLKITNFGIMVRTYVDASDDSSTEKALSTSDDHSRSVTD